MKVETEIAQKSLLLTDLSRLKIKFRSCDLDSLIFLTKQIAASSVDVVCLLAPGSDPHVYKLTPEARQSIEDAKLVLYGGYDFEPAKNCFLCNNQS